MKVSLITLHYVHNYGSVLQTFATQFLFKKAGYEVETVNYTRENCKLKSRVAENNATLKAKKRGRLLSLSRALRYLNFRLNYCRKRRIFGKFVQDHIRLSRAYETATDLMKNPPCADIYCTGSDQTWNSIHNGGILPEYFLAYAPEGKKRVAFAASFGRTDLDNAEIEATKPFIQKYSAISVRESTALAYLERMGFTGAVHVLDPTLAMSGAEWEAQLDIPAHKGGRYVLMFVLNSDNLAAIGKFAQRIAKDEHLRLINMTVSLRAFFMPGKKARFPSVEEFLSLIQNAEYIVTDSFHGTAFSLNFGKQVFSFYSDRFSTRIQSILSLTGLERRAVGDPNTDYKAIEPIDYVRVNPIIEQEREKTLRFIKGISR